MKEENNIQNELTENQNDNFCRFDVLVGMPGNANKIILDLCGGTGSWSKPYRDAGYDVRLITLPDHDVRIYNPPENVYGILAAPPCDQFSLARGQKGARDIQGGLCVVEACLKIIWQCKPKFWAMENPMGLLRKFLGKPPLTFEPLDFGDDYTKKTDLWGYYKMPSFNKIKQSKESKTYQRINHMHKPPAAKMYPGTTRAARRAITPQGFAEAFYRANK